MAWDEIDVDTLALRSSMLIVLLDVGNGVVLEFGII